MGRLKKIATSEVSDEILEQLNHAVNEKSYVYLIMAYNLTEQNKKRIEEQFGDKASTIIHNVSAICQELSAYINNQEHYGNKTPFEGFELPDWSIKWLKELINDIRFTKTTIDAVNEASDNLKNKDDEINKLKSEINQALDNRDEEQFKELSDKLRKLEGSKKRLMKKRG